MDQLTDERRAELVRYGKEEYAAKSPYDWDENDGDGWREMDWEHRLGREFCQVGAAAIAAEPKLKEQIEKLEARALAAEKTAQEYLDLYENAVKKRAELIKNYEALLYASSLQPSLRVSDET